MRSVDCHFVCQPVPRKKGPGRLEALKIHQGRRKSDPRWRPVTSKYRSPHWDGGLCSHCCSVIRFLGGEDQEKLEALKINQGRRNWVGPR